MLANQLNCINTSCPFELYRIVYLLSTLIKRLFQTTPFDLASFSLLRKDSPFAKHNGTQVLMRGDLRSLVLWTVSAALVPNFRLTVVGAKMVTSILDWIVVVVVGCWNRSHWWLPHDWIAIPLALWRHLEDRTPKSLPLCWYWWMNQILHSRAVDLVFYLPIYSRTYDSTATQPNYRNRHLVC